MRLVCWRNRPSGTGLLEEPVKGNRSRRNRSRGTGLGGTGLKEPVCRRNRSRETGLLEEPV